MDRRTGAPWAIGHIFKSTYKLRSSAPVSLDKVGGREIKGDTLARVWAAAKLRFRAGAGRLFGSREYMVGAGERDGEESCGAAATGSHAQLG
jgi:hypothetical protein